MEENFVRETEGPRGNMASYFVIGMVCLLLVFSAVQAFQINEIKDGIKDGNIDVTKTTGQAVRQQATQTQAAPAMVGGC